MPKFSANQNFWGCACTFSSYTTALYTRISCIYHKLSAFHFIQQINRCTTQTTHWNWAARLINIFDFFLMFWNRDEVHRVQVHTVCI